MSSPQPKLVPDITRPPGPTRYRYVILIFMWLAVFLNYLDRATLSVVLEDVKAEIGASDAQMGVILSAFAWSITAVIVVFGYLMQRYGARLIGTISLLGFSLMTILTGMAGSFITLFVTRLGLGVFEAPTFPLNSALARTWFPQAGRAKAVSTYMTGSFFGLAFAVPILGMILNIFGNWRSVFFFAGGLGVLIALAWYLVLRSTPLESMRVSQQELDLITSGDEAAPVVKPPRPNGADWLSVLLERRLVGIYLGAFGTSTVVFFFITWFPSYLTSELGFDFKTGSAILAALPYICGMGGMLTSGWLSDKLIKSGKSPGQARKVTVTVGLLGSTVIALVPLLDSNQTSAILALLCVCFFFAGMANTAWLLASEIAKPRLLGLTTGVYGFWVNLFGAITPIVVGILLTNTDRNFGVVFGYVGAAALLGVLGYVVLVDRVEPSRDKRFPDGVPATVDAA